MLSGVSSRRGRRLTVGVIAVLLLNLLLFGAAQKVVTIGFSLPLTGGAAKEGTESRVGAELAAQYLNDAGGFEVGGENVTIKLVFEDDLCTPQGAVEAANRLAVAGATFVGGSFCSSSALAQMPVFAALGIPQPEPGTPADAPVMAARDELSGETYFWSANPYVRLDPHSACAHVLAVRPL